MIRAEASATVEAAVPVLAGESPVAAALRVALLDAAQEARVLFEAERGMELSAAARVVHARAGRPGPLVIVDCAAPGPVTADRQLFGAARGGRTGEMESVAAGSALAAALQGTLYLAELAALPARTQQRLARVARDRRVRIGGREMRFDGGVIGEVPLDTDSSPPIAPELLATLDVSRVTFAPLRRRPEDIPAILGAMLADAPGLPSRSFTPEAVAALAAMPWRGNLAELRQAVSRLLGGSGRAAIGLDHVLAHVRFDPAVAAPPAPRTLRCARQQFEREYITFALQHHHGRVGEAARALGIQRTNLYRKARQLGIPVARAAQE